MASKSNMTLRIEPELKEQAAALFKSVKICTALLIALQK